MSRRSWSVRVSRLNGRQQLELRAVGALVLVPFDEAAELVAELVAELERVRAAHGQSSEARG